MPECAWIFDPKDIRLNMDSNYMDENLHNIVLNMMEAEPWHLQTEYLPSPRGVRDHGNVPIMATPPVSISNVSLPPISYSNTSQGT